MRKRYSFGYMLSQSFKSFFRNGMMSLASVAVLLSCLTVMGAFALLVLNINANLEGLGTLNDIVVYCDVNDTKEQVEKIGNKIRSLDNVKAETVKLITKEEALIEERQKYSEYTDLFNEMDKDGKNPYPDTYIIEYNDNSKVSTLQYELEQIEGVSKIKCRADLAESIASLKRGVIFVFTWFLAILFVVSIFVIINTIKLALFSRSQEITVMRYVGATRFFITTPFILEGVIIGLISSLLAFLIEWYAYGAAVKAVSANYTMITVVPFEDVRWIVLAAFVGVGVLTGIVGSWISLRKYAKA